MCSTLEHGYSNHNITKNGTNDEVKHSELKEVIKDVKTK